MSDLLSDTRAWKHGRGGRSAETCGGSSSRNRRRIACDGGNTLSTSDADATRLRVAIDGGRGAAVLEVCIVCASVLTLRRKGGNGADGAHCSSAVKTAEPKSSRER